MILDHVDIRVSNVGISRAFYEAALTPLGVGVVSEKRDPAGGEQVGFGVGGEQTFTIHSVTSDPGQDTVTVGAHIAFRAPSREAADAFHAAALGQGAPSVGDPGPRPVYSAGYYGAFVLDPDGNNVEAVFYDT
jgi:catechol 2,3-dioxygenase-like lactoylglutathione lyase family enzyme